MSVITEVAQHLHNQGIASLASNLFYSYLPESPDVAVMVNDTGGATPDEYLPLKDPTFQIMVRDIEYVSGKAKVDQIRAALHQKENTQLLVNGIYFYFIFLMGEGGHIGRDEAGRDLFSINFRCRTR